MKTLKQIISEAKAAAKPKGPPKEMKVDTPEDMLDTGKNSRGVEYGMLHVRGDIPKESRKNFDERLKRHMMNYVTKMSPMSPESHVGAWLANNGHATFFEHGKVSHGAVRSKTVAADDKDAMPVTVMTTRGKTTVHYHGKEPLTDEMRERILNHKGLTTAFGTNYSIAED